MSRHRKPSWLSIYKWWHKHHKNHSRIIWMKSFVFNVMLLSLLFNINDNIYVCCIYDATVCTIFLARSRNWESNSSWCAGSGPKWPQHITQETSKCSSQFILTHDRTHLRQYNNGPEHPTKKKTEREKKRKINKQNNNKKAGDGHNVSNAEWNPQEKRFFIFYKEEKLEPKISFIPAHSIHIDWKLKWLMVLWGRFLWSEEYCQRFDVKTSNRKKKKKRLTHTQSFNLITYTIFFPWFIPYFLSISFTFGFWLLLVVGFVLARYCFIDFLV